MRKVDAGLFSSIDGVVERPNEWQPAFDEEMGVALARMLDGQDAVLLGRVTFTEWAGYWPTSTDEPFASWINGTQKYVASTTLDGVDSWENSTLIKGPVTDFVADLREQDGGTIGVGGSPSLVRSLITAGLLDELTLMISPVVAGGGRRRLFPDDAAPATFELAEATPTSTGTLIATYRRAPGGDHPRRDRGQVGDRGGRLVQELGAQHRPHSAVQLVQAEQSRRVVLAQQRDQPLAVGVGDQRPCAGHGYPAGPTTTAVP